jgi:hypothetical protein
MKIELLPQKEKLTRNAATFKCEDCQALIGAQKDNAGNIKPESLTNYYRVQIKGERISWKFVCTKCSYKY